MLEDVSAGNMILKMLREHEMLLKTPDYQHPLLTATKTERLYQQIPTDADAHYPCNKYNKAHIHSQCAHTEWSTATVGPLGFTI